AARERGRAVLLQEVGNQAHGRRVRDGIPPPGVTLGRGANPRADVDVVRRGDRPALRPSGRAAPRSGEGGHHRGENQVGVTYIANIAKIAKIAKSENAGGSSRVGVMSSVGTPPECW